MNELTDPFTQLDDDINLSSYQTAGAIAARVLDQIVVACKVGAKLVDLCNLGDTLIEEEVIKVHKKIKCKGVAFPTCVSLNQVVGHYNNPGPNELIQEGDLAKIELGIHFNGFPAQVCYTVVVKESDTTKIDNKKVRVMKAVAEASKEVLKQMKPDKSNLDIIKAMEKSAKKYDCTLPYTDIEMHSPGTSSFQVSQHVVDGFNEDSNKYIHSVIINRDCENYEFVQVEQPLEENEVYAIDIVMSSGSGRLTQLEDNPCTVFKRNQDKKSMLKLKASKSTLNHFSSSRFPQSTRSLNSDSKFRFGLKECVNKELLEPYPPMTEKKDEYVARIKFTAIVRKKPLILIGRSSDEQLNKLKVK